MDGGVSVAGAVQIWVVHAVLSFACLTWQKNFKTTSRMLRFEKQIVEHRPAAGNDIPGMAQLWSCSPEGILLLRHYFMFAHKTNTGI